MPTPFEQVTPEDHRALREDQFAPVVPPGATVLERDRAQSVEEPSVPEEDRTSAVYDHLAFATAPFNPVIPEQDRQNAEPDQPSVDDFRVQQETT